MAQMNIAICSFQSTLPRGERPVDFLVKYVKPEVSIHAPAGGATKLYVDGPYSILVSIHAPAGGATIQEPAHLWSGAGFNPRSRGGSDPRPRPPTKKNILFQSTLPRGERQSPFWFLINLKLVSIHAPAGGATSNAKGVFTIGEVSIHAPAGGATSFSEIVDTIQSVSIHAPAGGAT